MNNTCQDTLLNIGFPVFVHCTDDKIYIKIWSAFQFFLVFSKSISQINVNY